MFWAKIMTSDMECYASPNRPNGNHDTCSIQSLIFIEGVHFNNFLVWISSILIIGTGPVNLLLDWLSNFGLDTFIESMNLSVSPDLFSLKELPAKASSLGVSEVQETPVSLPVDTRKDVAVSPQVTNTGGQVMANATLGSRYLGGIDYNRMNTAQKADYVDKVFKV